MSKREYRFGGGLNYRASEDLLDDGELLKASSVVFTEPGAATVETPPYSIQSALLHAVLTNDKYDFVQGIADAYLNGSHFLFIKNDHAWQRTGYDGSSPTSIPIGSLTATVLTAGDNAVVYTGAIGYYQAPSNGTVVVKCWGAGGGGGKGAGYGTGNGGGAGGFATTTIAVSAGDILTAYVGQGGFGAKSNGTSSAGGWPDGGRSAVHSAGGAGAAGGGGSSRVYLNGVLALVAGAGGGGGLEGGSGGGTSGVSASNAGGTGGSQSAGGVDASDTGDSVKFGASFQGGVGGTDSTVDAGGGGGGGYFGGGGGGGASVATTRPGGGGSGYLGGLGTSESFTTNVLGTQSPAANSGDGSYSASAGRRTGNPDSDTATGGFRDATLSSNDGNPGGNGYVVVNFTSGGGGGSGTQTSAPGNHQLSAIRYNGFVYITDGYTFRRYFYDTSTATYKCQRVGLARPIAPSAASESGSGSTVAGVTYKWAVTYCYVDPTGAVVVESNMSPFLEYTAIANSKQVGFTIPTDSQALTGTNARRIYRSNNNGDAMFYVGIVSDNTTTSYTDSVGLSTLKGDPYAVVGDPADGHKMPGILVNQTIGQIPYERPSAAVHSSDAELRGEIVYTNLGALADWRNHDQPTSDADGTVRNIRLLEDVVYGIVNNTSLAFTLVGNAEYWSPFNVVIVGRNSGETLQDIQVWDKDIICYTDRAVYRFRRFGVDATESTLEKVSDVAGCCSENGVVVTENQGHIFMGWDGIYQFDGRTVRKISHAIDDIWRDSTNTDYIQPAGKSTAVAGGKNDKVWFGYRGVAEGTYPSGYYNTRLIHLDLTDGSVKWATAPWNMTSLHRGYDGTLFGGGEADNLSILDHTAITQLNSGVAIRTKLFPLGTSVKNRSRVEKVALDADLVGCTLSIGIYAGSYDNQIATWTIQGASERRIYTKALPLIGAYDRLGLSMLLLLTATTVRAPKFYSCVIFDTGQDSEA